MKRPRHRRARLNPSRVLQVLACTLMLSEVFGTAAAAQLAPIGATISGKVLDRQGEPVEGVTVRIVGERRFRTQTDRFGYRFSHLPPDEYSVEVTGEGYITAVVEQVGVFVGDSLRIDFRLKTGRPNAVSMTSMPIIDTTTAGAAYRLFDPPLGSLPTSGTLASVERLLPQESEIVTTSSIYVDGGELLPEQALDFVLWRPTVSRLAAELFESVDLFGSRVDPRIRTLDSHQLLTRTTTQQWHGNFGVRYSDDTLSETNQPGRPDEERLVRPHAAMLFPVGSRFRTFGAVADHRSRAQPGSLGGNVDSQAFDGLSSRRHDATRYVRLEGGPIGPSLDLRASFLEVDADERTRADSSSERPVLSRLQTAVRRSLFRLNRFSGRIDTIAQFNDRRATTVLDDEQTRRIRTKEVAVSFDTVLARYAFELGGSTEETSGDLLAASFDPSELSSSLVPQELRLERRNLHLSNRWRATRNIDLQLGLRYEQLEWNPSGLVPIAGDHESWLMPRFGFAWDVFGNGEWALLASAGRELVRQVATFDLGLQPFLAQGLPPTDRVEVDAVSVGTRYQLFPGLIVDSELGRRRYADETSDALRPRAEEEKRLRFGAEARISKNWQARGLYELRDLGRIEPGRQQVASPVELGTTQRTHLHLARYFEAGWVVSGVFEYVDEFNIAMRSLGVVTEVPRDTVTPRSSLAQFDLLIEYSWSQLPPIPLLGNKPPKIVWKLEILNVLDRQSRPVAVPDVFIGSGIEGLYPYPTLSTGPLLGITGSDLITATQQQGRRIWFGFGVEI